LRNSESQNHTSVSSSFFAIFTVNKFLYSTPSPAEQEQGRRRRRRRRRRRKEGIRLLPTCCWHKGYPNPEAYSHLLLEQGSELPAHTLPDTSTCYQT
jgi:hypothetical protein